MIISLIVAMDESNGIAVANQIPWRISSDLRRFKRITLGHHLIMGRKTWETIGKPLPGRVSIVITRQKKYIADGCIVFNSLKKALDYIRSTGETETFIIGGADLFCQSVDKANRLYISYIHTKVAADLFFPKIDTNTWFEIKRESIPADASNQFPHTFVVYERKSKDHTL